MHPTCVCLPGQVDGHAFSPFWGRFFGECIYTPRQQIAITCGLVSLVLYGLALVPQFHKNYQRKSVEGLSWGLFAMWTLGDIANLGGSFLTQQFMTQKITGIYFLCTEVLFFLQYAYYTWIYTGRKPPSSRRTTHDPTETTPLLASFLPVATIAILIALPTIMAAPTAILSAQWSSNASSESNPLSLPKLPICDAEPVLPPNVVQMGRVLAWASGLFYFCSRFPQIHTNYKLQSTAGISMTLFSITLIANLFYGLSILLRADEITRAKFFASTLPFVIGSLGTCLSDLVVYWQHFLYRHHHTEEEEDLS